jgi:hypothetical protein
VRFLGRKVYLAVQVTLLCAMRQGPSPRTAHKLRSLFGVDRRTLCLWRHWWQVLFPASDFWRRKAARFMPPVDEAQLPQSLVERFTGSALTQRILSLMRLLSPIGISYIFDD